MKTLSSTVSQSLLIAYFEIPYEHLCSVKGVKTLKNEGQGEGNFLSEAPRHQKENCFV